MDYQGANGIQDTNSMICVHDQKLKGDFKEEDTAFCYDWIQKWKKIKSESNKIKDVLHGELPASLSTSNIKIYVLKYGIRQLSLNVTEDCNFECRYCVYSSGRYEYARSHSTKRMNFSIAKKAIDYYFSLLNDGKRYNPNRTPAVSFFGGEPLLNFSLIKECVEYISDEYGDYEVTYGLTTNGSLLEDKISWLIQNNFDINISLDGPEEQHDANRVYRNGKGTFKDVMENIAKLNDAKYKKVSIISTYDWRCDLFKCHEFFNRSDIPRLAFVGEVLKTPGCKYYGQFTEVDRMAFAKQLEKAKAYYLETIGDQEQQGKKSSVFDKLFCDNPIQMVHGCRPAFSGSSIMPFTSACIPGDKIFVDVNGDFHICEKIIATRPIGSVDEGLNFEKIRKFISDYLHHMDKCASCKLRMACPFCYIHFMTDNGFLCSSDVCKKVEALQSSIFSMAFSIGEIDQKYIDMSSLI